MSEDVEYYIEDESERPLVQLLSHQIDFVYDTHEFVGLVGGYRSGKTVSLCHKAIWLAAQNVGYEGALLEPTHGMVKRTLKPVMDKLLQQIGLPHKYFGSIEDRHYKLFFPTGTVKIHLLAAESYSRAAGLTLAWFGVDEFDLVEKELAIESWQMLVSRLTNGNLMQGFITSTPEGYNFLYHFFVDQVDQAVLDGDVDIGPDRRLIRADTEDNPFIDQKYIARMKRQFPEKLLAAYLKGHFVNLTTGNVYYAFDRNINNTGKTYGDYKDEKNIQLLHIGVDFNKGNMSAVVCVVDNKKIYVIDEISGLHNTEALANEIKRRYPLQHKRNGIICYPDSSGKNEKSNTTVTDIMILEQAGFRTAYPNKNPPVGRRVGAVNCVMRNALGESTCYVNPNRCPKLVKSLEQQGYKNGEPDKTTGLDHMVDAFGYFISFRFPLPIGGNVRIL